MQKKENDRFIGLWRHKAHGWEIKYQQNGKKHSEFRKDEREAKLRAEYWKAVFDTPPEGSDEVHPVIFWERMLRQAAALLLKNPTDKDVAATCRSVAAMATAAMRTAKYIPAPIQSSPDGAPVTGDMSNMTSEELREVLGTNTD